MRRIRAVFLDFYNTVAGFYPPRELIQVQSAAAFGVHVTQDAVRLAYLAADDFLSRENSRLPIDQRSPEQRADLWARYEQHLLANAGARVGTETAGQVFQYIRAQRQTMALFDDALPTLRVLKERGYRTALLSNLDDDLDAIAASLGLSPVMDFTLTSRQVGAAKPHPPIFLEALRRVGAQPQQAVHVGDQYLGDVIGARGVGIHPIMIDREGSEGAAVDCTVIRSLTELPPLLESLENEGGDAAGV